MSATDPASLERAVLEANASFYRAFSAGDFDAMSELWAKRAPIHCLHPGAPSIAGRAGVLESWRGLLAARPTFPIRCHSPVVTLLPGSVAMVICYEGGEGAPAHLAATNLFILEDGVVRMVHHHAGPLSETRRERPPRGRGLPN